MQSAVGEDLFVLPPRVANDPAPGLQIHPIFASYTPPSRLASLGITAIAWALAAGTCLLGFHWQARNNSIQSIPRNFVALLINEPESLTAGGGGHQGPTPKAAPEPPKPVDTPPQAQSVPDNVPPPTALPTQPIPAPQPSPVLGSGGAAGTGNGYGQGKGAGSGTGDGNGDAGSGSGSGSGAEPILVPYSQIGLLKVINPNYPEKARRVGLEGDVVVRVTIDENGKPVDLRLVKGESLFVNEALKVLPKWRFTPVTHLGKRVRATFDAVLKFNLA
jgi:TonB family protein